MPSAMPLRERLFSRLIIDRETGCLLWTGAKDRDGYGRVKVDDRDEFVHRVMYRMFVGEIPDGLQLDHVKARGCVNRHCASPAHLEAVTPLVNTLRTAQAAVTHCPADHEYDLLNTYWTPGGQRRCRACKRASDRRRPSRARTRATDGGESVG